ncbi:site-specific integrase [Caballeronia sp. LZ025]|uniref:site-specific integrase n=1 Tax=Caballeronia sp. LZ025 TaxID=3038562 RepID=UPI002854890B|nr:site-specific integrase [Caballeronia sp. LZ025]MDR5734656.1 site-specific integrase [Caballeronia sp. LZ025]
MADNKGESSIGGQPSVHTAAPRRLTRQHFALYRGYLDGVTEAQLHASYGEAGSDVRSTRRLIAALRDTLSVMARRAHDVEAAHLLRLRPGSIPPSSDTPAPETPTLEAFRERIDPDGVYSESELLALYKEEHRDSVSAASDRRTARNARLRRRQANALARMEASLVQDPSQEHPIDGWFEPVVTARLAAAGLTTIADLIALIERRRHRWYASVPRLGPKGAQRIVDWLVLHAEPLRHTLSPLALVPRRQWRSEQLSTRPADSDVDAIVIAPLEALRVPRAVDGSTGTNRAPTGIGNLDTDVAAIKAWLDARSASEHTRRAYRREAERLLLWALIEKEKPLSSLDPDDCAQFVSEFLTDPQPAERWISRQRIERCLPGWKPFAGPLSDRSRETSRAILNAMFQWLVDSGYLSTNPMQGHDRVVTPPAFDARERALNPEEWQAVLRSATRPQYTFAEHRDRLALLLAYATGLRRAELADATTDALSVGRLPGIDTPVWRLRVGQTTGKRSVRTVLIPPAVIDVLLENLSLRGLPNPLDCAEGTPILAQSRGGQAITPDGIGRIIKNAFSNAAAEFESAAPGTGRPLARASTHWLRHTHSIHALAHGAELADVSKGLGHADASTTALYLQHEDASRLLGVERFIRHTLALGNASESA